MIFSIAFLFPPASCGLNGMIIHLLIFPCTGVRSEFFIVAAFLGGSYFWSSVGPILEKNGLDLE